MQCVRRIGGSPNSIAEQLLKDDRIVAAMRAMLAKMVWQKFQKSRSA